MHYIMTAGQDIIDQMALLRRGLKLTIISTGGYYTRARAADISCKNHATNRYEVSIPQTLRII